MAIEKDSAARICLRAYAALQLKKYGDASMKAREALKVRANYPLAHHINAFAMKEMGNFKDAQYAITQAIDQEPGNANHIFLLGLILWSSGDADEADKKLQEALRLEPRNKMFNLNYSLFLIYQRNFEEAFKIAKELKDKHPYDEQVKLLYSATKSQDYKQELSIISYMPPIPVDPEDPSTYIELGKLYLETGYFDSALAELDKAILKDPNNNEAQSLSATVYMVKSNKFYRVLWNFSSFILSPVMMPIVILVFLGIVALSCTLTDYQKVLGVIGFIYFIFLVAIPLWVSRGRSAEEYKSMEEERLIEDIPLEDVLGEKEESTKDLDSSVKIRLEKKAKLYKSISQTLYLVVGLLFVGIIIVAVVQNFIKMELSPSVGFIIKIIPAILIGAIVALFPIATLFNKKAQQYSKF